MPSPEDILRRENAMLREELGTLKKLANMNARLSKENASAASAHAGAIVELQNKFTAVQIKNATLESRLGAVERAIASNPLPGPTP